MSKMMQEIPVAVQAERKTCVYEDLSGRFLFQTKLPTGDGNQCESIKIKRNFGRQYSHIYAERLMQSRPVLVHNAQIRWGADIVVKNLTDLVPQEDCVIIGTVYKQMKMKPCILDDLNEDLKFLPTITHNRFTHKSDRIILEDQLQRIRLMGNIDTDNIVTGVMIAARGSENADRSGCFTVSDVVYLHMGSQTPLPKQLSSPSKLLAIVSGLNLGGKNSHSTGMPSRIWLLLNQLAGRLSGDEETLSTMASVVRLLIAGNSVSGELVDKQMMAQQAMYLSRKTAASTIQAISELDNILRFASGILPVDIMPGESDPSGVLWPQQPLHQVMFPNASQLTSFGSHSNPYYFTLDGVHILGTTGLNIRQLYQYTDIDNALDRMAATLTWGHVAPTCPDTLPCYPYSSEEPFMLHTFCPHVYFVGNQNEFAWRKQRFPCKDLSDAEVLLVAVPHFDDTGICVLVDLNNLTCSSIHIPNNATTQPENTHMEDQMEINE